MEFPWESFKKGLSNPEFVSSARSILGDERFEIAVKLIASEHIINDAINSTNEQERKDILVKVAHLHEEIQTDITNLPK